MTTNDENTPLDALKPGTKYKIVWDDCCTSGFFYGTFLREGKYRILIFDNGEVEGANFYEVISE